jgi:hypothetical protein
MNTYEWIKRTFLKMTEKTYPYGYEEDFVKEMVEAGILPNDLSLDSEGNYFYKIGDSKTIFTSHFDTACSKQSDVRHVINGDIVTTDGTSILGADDKAGVTILLWMIKNRIPGLYYFFIGEEVGCVGSSQASQNNSEFFKGYHRMISFDRRGTDSIITYQSSRRTASDGFASVLANQLNKSGLSYKKDSTGIYTDSAEFSGLISECTNISVGYYNEHTTIERQDLRHLTNLATACLRVNWESLPSVRSIDKVEYADYSRYIVNSKNKRSYSNNNNNGYVGNGWDGESNKRVRSKRKGYNSQNKGNGYGSGYNSLPMPFLNDDDEDFDQPYVPGRKVYLDSGKGTLTEIGEKSITTESVSTSGKYESIKDEILNNSFSEKEIQIIKEQYLDPSGDPRDYDYYGYLISSYHDSQNLK